MLYTDEYLDDLIRAVGQTTGIEELNGRSVLITGATGMLCSGVADALLIMNRRNLIHTELILAGRNRESLCRRFSAFKEGTDYHFLQYDAANAENLSFNADYVIHGASNAHPAKIISEPVETMLSNLNGLAALLRAASVGGTRRLLYVSSSEVYGNIGEIRPMKEDDYGYVDILNPRASYPSAKRAAETFCVSWMKEYGLESVIVRPGHIYGPTVRREDSRASAAFSWNAADGEPIVMKSAGLQLRSYTYVADCASALLTVLLKGCAGEAYNISNPDSIASIREIADALAAAGSTELVFENPSDAEKSSFNLMSNSALDSEKLCALGWKGLFSLEEGCNRTIQVLKARIREGE